MENKQLFPPPQTKHKWPLIVGDSCMSHNPWFWEQISLQSNSATDRGKTPVIARGQVPLEHQWF